MLKNPPLVQIKPPFPPEELRVGKIFSESVFFDEGQGASGGVSYFANFLINLDQ